MIDTILTDLDGTLLPMTQKAFIDEYFNKLSRKFAALGYDPQKIVEAVWAGTKKMMANDGSKTNKTAFWSAFCDHSGLTIPQVEPQMDAFYQNEFDDVRHVMQKKPNSREIIEKLKQSGYMLVLATNPVFPPVAVRTRLCWAGLRDVDFDYVTTYENSSFCKPHPGYFHEILKNIGKNPEQCIMLGNNVDEDMKAELSGMQTYLVPEFLENEHHLDYTRYPQGTLEDFLKYVTKK